MALRTSPVAITAEIFFSEEPCAMALTLIPFLPSTPNILPLTPGWLFICSPTKAKIETSFSIIKGSTFCVLISCSNSASTAILAICASCIFTPTQIECSEELCVINIILICFLASASNNLLEKPGIPTIPVPSKLNKQISFILEMPLIKFLSAGDSFLIIVPAWLGSKVFFIHTGMFLCITG